MIGLGGPGPSSRSAIASLIWRPMLRPAGDARSIPAAKFGSWRGATGEPVAEIAAGEDGVWPRELQDPDVYTRAGAGSLAGDEVEDPMAEHKRTDFETLRDIDLDHRVGLDSVLGLLGRVFKHWIALCDCDGFRIDTLKHVTLEQARNFCGTITEFAANLDEHFKQCVFYDVLLGRYSMETLATAPDLWNAIAPGSQARAQRFLTRDGSGAVTSSIQTCREAYTALSGQWNGMVDDLGRAFGRQLYPKQTADLARAKLFADLPVAYQYLTGVSASASTILRQSLTINAMQQAMHSAAGTSGTGSVDVYAQTRADIQTERTYGSIAHAAMKWVPVLNIVLTVVFYAMFPVIFPLFLMPQTGVGALKGYLTGFFYLAAWGPLYVILHMICMTRATSAS